MSVAVLQPGLRHRETVRIGDAHTVPAMTPLFASFSEMPPVFATAYLVAFVEWTCTQALRGHLGEGQLTVGTRVELSHVAATPVGMQVTAEVELVAVEGRKLRFRAVCRDEAELIGEGFHERAVIDNARFLARMHAKAGISHPSA